VKRIGHLFESVVDRDNLLLAYAKASRGKALRQDRLVFAACLEENITALREGLLDGSYPVGGYTRFTIFDPKEREICAASFSERVLQHALMNVCEPWFDRWMIDDTYASRKGRGQLKAVRRAQYFAKRNRWFLRCDFRKYFDSLPHQGICRMLSRKFKDPYLLAWFDRLLDAYEVQPGKGLPIGNLTSQHFANLYLDPLDRLFAPYVRYMDDFILWHNDKDELKRRRDRIVAFCETELNLELKPTFINRSSLGMDFLGMRVYPDRVELNRNSKRRYASKVRGIMAADLPEAVAQERLTSLTAFVAQADSTAWRRELFGRIERVRGERPMATTA